MTIEIDKEGLQALVHSSSVYYNEFNNPLVKKAGHSFNSQYDRTSWRSLGNLNEQELYKLYLICKNSWK